MISKRAKVDQFWNNVFLLKSVNTKDLNNKVNGISKVNNTRKSNTL